MFESMVGAIIAHKHLVIAAIAISAVMVYAFPTTMIANADHRAINIERNVELRCLPYCQQAADVLGDGIERVTNNVHIRIGFSFLPR